MQGVRTGWSAHCAIWCVIITALQRDLHPADFRDIWRTQRPTREIARMFVEEFGRVTRAAGYITYAR
jgi:hypothetical protein